MLNINFGFIELDKASLVIAAASLAVLFLFVVVFGGLFLRTKRRLRDEYRLIYRVVSTPFDNQYILKAEGTSIEVGDYGWEAEPIHQDGLIYLHGLNARWQVVWYSGLRQDQVEIVGPKPCSQYYVFADWVDFRKIPQCPYPVQKHQYGVYPTFHFGFAAKNGREWVQGRQISKHI